MKVVVNKFFPFGGYKAMLIAVWLFCHRYPDAQTYNHENIHCMQGKEMLFIFFWLWYGIEWLVRLVQYRDGHKAYRNISFEREAYYFQDEEDYSEWRNHYDWINYL